MMSTVGSLMGVYGAIDEIVSDDRSEQIEVASRYLPVFSDPNGGPGWSREILALAQKHVADDATVVSYPSLEEALAELADADLSPSEAGRLIFAAGTLVRLDPDGEHVSPDRLIDALRSTTSDRDRDQAERLFQLLRDDDIFPERDAWASMISSAVDQGLLHSVMLSVDAPCSGTYVSFGGQLVTRLETAFTTNAVSMAQVKAVLDPLNWHVCCKYFCSMTPLPSSGGWRQVLEEFSFDCGQWHIRTGIQYWNRDLSGGGAAVSYDLASPRPAGDDLEALVDNGLITVKPDVDQSGNPFLRVHTSKNLLFDGPISGGGTAMWACLSGWADTGRDLILGCALKNKGIAPWQASADGADAAGGASGGGASGGGGGGGGGAMPRKRNVRQGPEVAGSFIVPDTVNWLTTCIDDLATKAGQCAEKAASGNVTANELIASTGELTSRLLADPAKLMGIAARARQAAVAPPPRPIPDPVEYEGPTR